MKNPLLSPADRAVVATLMMALMDCNNRNDVNADQRSTYGHISRAVTVFVLNQTGLDIGNEDWNLGGNRTFTDDVQAAIFKALERVLDAEKCKALESTPDGNLTQEIVSSALAPHGVQIMRDANGEDFIVSRKSDNAGQWFISSDLLECLEQGQRKALCALSGRAYSSPW